MPEKKLDKEYELLLQVAILKNNEQIRAILKDEFAPLNKHMAKLEENIESVNKRLLTVEDVIEPLAKIRKRLWLWVVGGAVTISIAGSVIAEYLKRVTNQ